jgi:Holliday junction DNA helicase RuvB
MPIVYEKLLALKIPEVEHSYGPKECMLYALGVGFGLDPLDRKILETILDKFQGGPVGLSTLAAAVGEDGETLEEIYEPYLIQIGFLDRTPRGRRVTLAAVEHLRREPRGHR